MPEKRCEACGKPFVPKRTTRVGRFCSVACYYSVGPRGQRKTAVKDQRMVRAKGHPIAPPSGTVARSRLVLYDKIGPGPHPCNWCGKSVDWKVGLVKGALIADHLNWDRQDDSPENLVPSCNACNSHRLRSGTRASLLYAICMQNDEEELTVVWSGSRTRAVRRYCNTCGKEFLTIPAEVKKGKGRFCSRSCARRRPS